MKKIEVEVPDGFELVKTQDGWKLEEVNTNVRLVNDNGGDDVICRDTDGNVVAYIGQGLAPDGLKGKCIALNDAFEWTFTTNNGYHICIPTKKSQP